MSLQYRCCSASNCWASFRSVPLEWVSCRAFSECDDVVYAKHTTLQEIEQIVGGSFNCNIAVLCSDGILPSLRSVLGILFARIRHCKNVGALCHEIKQLFLHDVPPSAQTHMRQSVTANSQRHYTAACTSTSMTC